MSLRSREDATTQERCKDLAYFCEKPADGCSNKYLITDTRDCKCTQYKAEKYNRLFPLWETLSKEINSEATSSYEPTVFCATKDVNQLSTEHGTYTTNSKTLARSLERIKAAITGRVGDMENITPQLENTRAGIETSDADLEKHLNIYKTTIQKLMAHVIIPANKKPSLELYDNRTKHNNVLIPTPLSFM